MTPKLIVLLAAVVFRVVMFGQFVNMPTTIKTPYGNVRTSTPVYMPRFTNNNWRNQKATDPYTIRVVYKNDSVSKVDGRIVTSDSLSMIVVDSTITISPRETKEITCSFSGQKKVKGFPADSSWLFTLTSGSIKVYSNVPFDEEAVVAMQKGNDGIVSFSQELLMQWIGSSDKIMDMIEKHQYAKAVRFYNGQFGQ